MTQDYTIYMGLKYSYDLEIYYKETQTKIMANNA